MRRLMITAATILATLGPVLADGLLVPPRTGLYPQPVPQPGSPSCLMTALQMGYLTGRREVAYANTEACLLFTRSRGAVLPYGYYGPYVPSGYFVPPGWLLPPPGYGAPGPSYGPPPGEGNGR
jgi:hypothetical protein